MEISKNITDTAILMLKKGLDLPAEIDGAPGFFLATHEDSSIHAMGSVEDNGVFYKIGPKKLSKTQ